MSSNTIVHFVLFETSLDSNMFIDRWDSFIRSVSSDVDVTLQESKQKNSFKYLLQHRCEANEFNYIFTQAAKLRRSKEVDIKINQLGGYILTQQKGPFSTEQDNSKIFAFVPSLKYKPGLHKEIKIKTHLTIYEAYYENCQYGAILEFLVSNAFVSELEEQLKQLYSCEIGIYTERVLHAV